MEGDGVLRCQDQGLGPLAQCQPAGLPAMMKIFHFCAIRYAHHQPHVAIERLKSG